MIQNNEDSGYNGNPLLKKTRRKINWTPEQIEEITKCADDPVYFSEKYIKVIHVDKGFIPIELFDYQKEFIQAFHTGRKLCANWSRQCGKTTAAVCSILHFIIFNSYKRVALLANKADTAQEILERIQSAYEALPQWLQHGVVTWNKRSIELENGSSILSGATSSGNIRGKSCAVVFIDETAHIERWDEFYASVYPTISSGEKTKLVFASTPKGLNHFHKTCVGAMNKSNGFTYIEVPWYKVPGRDEKWKQDTMESLDHDQDKFLQEFCCEFMGSSGTLISGSALKALVHRQPIHQTLEVKQYKAPIKDHSYVIVSDVSRGKGLDYSACQVIDVTKMPYEQVCVYRSNMVTPIDYAQEIFLISKLYNDASILVEVNDIGGQVVDSLHYDFECENIIYTESAGPRGKRISIGGKASERGIRTTKTVKSVGCSILKLLVEQQQLIINDHETINELSTFSKKRNSYEAEPGCHDDLVMCLVLFGWLSDQQYFKELTNINTLASLRDRSDEEIETQLTPFGIIDTGHYDEEVDDFIDLTGNFESLPDAYRKLLSNF